MDMPQHSWTSRKDESNTQVYATFESPTLVNQALFKTRVAGERRIAMVELSTNSYSTAWCTFFQNIMEITRTGWV